MGSQFDRIQERMKDQEKLESIIEKRVAQEAYGPLKIAVEIIGLLNTATMEPDTRSKSFRPHGTENPFDDDRFVENIKRLTSEFARMTGANAVGAYQVYNLMDEDIIKKKYIEARKKVTDLSLFFMDQTMRFLKREYPW